MLTPEQQEAAGPSSVVQVVSDITRAELGHAWRDPQDGVACATVYLATHTSIRFEDPADARALAVECLKAADAMEALHPAQDGGQE